MWFLGIDVGTTHVKVVGVTDEGAILEPLKMRTPVRMEGEASFHDGEAVYSAVQSLVEDYAAGPVERAGAGALAAISIGTFGQEESFPVDTTGTPLAGSRAWWENWPERSLDPGMVDWFDSVEHYRVSGMRFRDNQTPDRIAWFRAHSPELWAQAWRWVDFGTYIAFRITGNWMASSTQVTHSQLFSLQTLEPHAESFERLGLSASLFPPVGRPGDRIGEIRAESFRGVELTTEAAVHLGGHDQVMAAYANAMTDDTAVVDSIGTAEYVMVTGGAGEIDERLYAICADVERGWADGQYVLGWGLPTGKILQLLADRFCEGDFERLLAAIDPDAEISTGSDGTLPGLTFTVNDLRDPGEELFAMEGVPPAASPEQIVAGCVALLSRRIRNMVGLMSEIGGARLDSVALTGSLFQRPELVRQREQSWGVPLHVSGLREAAATGAAELARASYDRPAVAARPRVRAQ